MNEITHQLTLVVFFQYLLQLQFSLFPFPSFFFYQFTLNMSQIVSNFSSEIIS